jgi:hypothetical protein
MRSFLNSMQPRLQQVMVCCRAAAARHRRPAVTLVPDITHLPFIHSDISYCASRMEAPSRFLEPFEPSRLVLRNNLKGAKSSKALKRGAFWLLLVSPIAHEFMSQCIVGQTQVRYHDSLDQTTLKSSSFGEGCQRHRLFTASPIAQNAD